MKKVCLFTALTFDKKSVPRAKPNPLPQFNHYNWNCEAYLFTNDIRRVGKVSGWKIVEIDKKVCGKYFTRKIARYIKTRPHTVLPECDVYVWIDANIIVSPSFISFVDDFYKSEFDLQSMTHPSRRFTKDELKVCYKQKLDPTPIKFIHQQNFYNRAKFPDKQGLLETRVIFRRSTKLIECFNELWWNNINRFTVRDQCSIMFALWKLDIKFNSISYTAVEKSIRLAKQPSCSTNVYSIPTKTLLKTYYSMR